MSGWFASPNYVRESKRKIVQTYGEVIGQDIISTIEGESGFSFYFTSKWNLKKMDSVARDRRGVLYCWRSDLDPGTIEVTIPIELHLDRTAQDYVLDSLQDGVTLSPVVAGTGKNSFFVSRVEFMQDLVHPKVDKKKGQIVGNSYALRNTCLAFAHF